MIKALKKLAATLIALQILLAPVAFTHTEERTAFAEELKNLEFNVTKYLKLKGKNEAGEDITIQAQSYFTENGDSEDQSAFPVIRLIVDVIETAVKVTGTIAVFMLILTGFVMIFSQGNQNIIEKAKQMFLYEVIGTAVIFLSYVLVTIVQGIFTI